jgi:regulator of replication initiation timing
MKPETSLLLRLESKLITLENRVSFLEKENKELKAENKELKSRLKIYENSNTPSSKKRNKNKLLDHTLRLEDVKVIKVQEDHILNLLTNKFSQVHVVQTVPPLI